MNLEKGLLRDESNCHLIRVQWKEREKKNTNTKVSHVINQDEHRKTDLIKWLFWLQYCFMLDKRAFHFSN